MEGLFEMVLNREIFTQLEKLMLDLNVAADQLHHLDEPNQNIKKHEIQQWAINFGTDGSMYGKWPGLSIRWTIPERVMNGQGLKMLNRTGYYPSGRGGGALYAHFIEQNQDGIVNDLGVTWTMVNANNAFTVRHDSGYANPISGKSPIPARKLWDINAQDEKYMVDEMSLYVDQVLMRHFL